MFFFFFYNFVFHSRSVEYRRRKIETFNIEIDWRGASLVFHTRGYFSILFFFLVLSLSPFPFSFFGRTVLEKKAISLSKTNIMSWLEAISKKSDSFHFPAIRMLIALVLSARQRVDGSIVSRMRHNFATRTTGSQTESWFLLRLKLSSILNVANPQISRSVYNLFPSLSQISSSPVSLNHPGYRSHQSSSGFHAQ